MRCASILLICAFFFAASCDQNKPPTLDIDRESLLTRYADTLIIPAYKTLDLLVDTLLDAISRLPEDTSNLPRAQEAWGKACLAWQNCNAYNFGPAGERGIRKTLNEEIATFPVDTATLQGFIAASDTGFNNFKRDTRGIYSLEYLLFAHPQSLKNSLAYQQYALAVSRHLKKETTRVKSEWNTYREEFIENIGTDAGSSISLLYNEFVKSYEAAKNFKVGLPAGKRPGQLLPAPHLTECYYSGKSLPALKQHLIALKAIYDGYYPGKSMPIPVEGFRQYLRAAPGGPELVMETEKQWFKVLIALDLIPKDKNLSESMLQNDLNIEALYHELQIHTRYFKSDMSSLLGITITYSSGDGD